MTKSDKKQHKMLTEEDMRIIKSDPAGLADYIVRTKVKSVRKSALIMTLIAVSIAFGSGLFVGMSLAKTSIPNNVVQVHVGGEDAPVVETEKAEEGK